jgi:hypothetical protein
VGATSSPPELTELRRESAHAEAAALERLIDSEFRYLVDRSADWSLTRGPQDLELVAHALRCILHVDRVTPMRAEFEALAAVQHRDGGFSPHSADAESTVWVSAFCGLMLIRGNAILQSPELGTSVRRAIDYFLDTQHGDGRWTDPRWADLDTTSHPVSFFNVVLALGESHRQADVERAWRTGMRFILDAQAGDGGWYDPEFHPSGVEITAHLIQDALVADVLLGDRIGVAGACARGLGKLRSMQARSGSWDDDNVDHTMDCTRSTMLVARLLAEKAPDVLREVEADSELRWIERGFAWILAVKNPSGWPDFPGMETNLERTCDGIDTLIKYRAFRAGDWQRIARLWGYAG